MSWAVSPSGDHVKLVKSDDAIFRKYKSLGVNVERLEPGRRIIHLIPHRNVQISASADEILAYNLTTKQAGELNFHWPLSKWTVDRGDANWLEKVYSDFGWKL